ncbi:hypothetical protein F4604DRAFT_1714589 [Suillus subluteus]|nr:hypothetical protein F4604DRAFT_1714589 [Suillus subluteus]
MPLHLLQHTCLQKSHRRSGVFSSFGIVPLSGLFPHLSCFTIQMAFLNGFPRLRYVTPMQLQRMSSRRSSGPVTLMERLPHQVPGCDQVLQIMGEIFAHRRISTRRGLQFNSGCTGALYPLHSKTNIKPRPNVSTVLVPGRSLPILPSSMALSTSISFAQPFVHWLSSCLASCSRYCIVPAHLLLCRRDIVVARHFSSYQFMVSTVLHDML